MVDGPRGGRHGVSLSKSRSVVLPDLPKTRSTTREKSKASVKRNVSIQPHKPPIVPNFEEDLYFEDADDQPILLPRRKPKRPVVNRSLSQLEQAPDDVLFEDEVARRVVHKPPPITRGRPAKTAQGVRSNGKATFSPPSRRRGKLPSSYIPPKNDNDDDDDDEEEAEGGGDYEDVYVKPTRVRRPRPVAPPAKPPKASADDPMAVFFEAAFPSPSKFDDMMMQSGGLPEARRNGGRGRGRSRQTNLILPSSIIRHR
ncbi:unnamed protein product [Phytomonas sp. Hart1]|nr:unnamed protein product [Phytomonas sp. Hart1]|eukprot:CCW71128.1 unnamed protein product [Phytomonas sp. isolate Hart1]